MLHYVSSLKFRWLSNYKRFMADISDLGPDFSFDRVYNDAYDVGFVMVSHKTGAEVKFVITTHCTDREGDITHWELVPVSEAIRANPKLNGVIVTIWND